MFKKLLTVLTILSPFLWILAFGYPVKENGRPKAVTGYSRRCYQTDSLNEYVGCFSRNRHLKGIELVATVVGGVLSILR